MRNFLSGDLGPKSAFLVSLWSNATMCGISDMLTRHELACAYSRALLNEAGSMLKCEESMYIITQDRQLAVIFGFLREDS